MIDPIIEDRFWGTPWKPKVDFTGSPLGCWIWLGAKFGKGYGAFRVSGRKWMEKAHRFSWEIAHGSIPEGLLVCHKCDNPLCVNPEHLFLGTDKDNFHDAMAKGRVSLRPKDGRPSYHSKMAWEKVRELRATYEASDKRRGIYVKLGRQFHLTPEQISHIIRKQDWIE